MSDRSGSSDILGCIKRNNVTTLVCTFLLFAVLLLTTLMYASDNQFSSGRNSNSNSNGDRYGRERDSGLQFNVQEVDGDGVVSGVQMDESVTTSQTAYVASAADANGRRKFIVNKLPSRTIYNKNALPTGKRTQVSLAGKTDCPATETTTITTVTTTTTTTTTTPLNSTSSELQAQAQSAAATATPTTPTSTPTATASATAATPQSDADAIVLKKDSSVTEIRKALKKIDKNNYYVPGPAQFTARFPIKQPLIDEKLCAYEPAGQHYSQNDLTSCISTYRQKYWQDKQQHFYNKHPCNTNRRIFDTFTFNDEVHLLEIRLEELFDVVDYFVIVESDIAFSGVTKSLTFADQLPRWEKYASKIIHVKCDLNHLFAKMDMNDLHRGWPLEYLSRDCALLALSWASDQDLMIVGDVDEIPKPEVLSALRMCSHQFNALGPAETFAFCGLRFIANFRWRDRQYPRWCSPKLATVGHARRRSPSAVKGTGPHVVVEEAAWHCSWCFFGSAELMRSKLEKWSELHETSQTLDDKDMMDLQSNCPSSKHRGHRCEYYPHIKLLPEFVQNNPEKFKGFMADP